MEDLERFETYLRDCTNASPLTVKNYVSDIRKYMRDFGTLDDAPARLSFVNSARSHATKVRRYYSLQAFIRYSIRAGRLAKGESMEDIMERPKLRPGAPKPVSDKRYAAFVQYVKDTDVLKWYEKTIILLQVVTGRRISEILNLRLEDVEETEHGYTLIINGKGGQTDTAFVGRTTDGFKYLHTHLDGKAPAGRVFEFVGDAYQAFYHVWSTKLCPGFNTHRIRHTLATKILNQTGNLKLVADTLGHKSLQTGQRYAKLYDDTRRKALDTINFV
jgi:integrase/recombinase XerC